VLLCTLAIPTASAVSYNDFLEAIESATFDYSPSSPTGMYYYLTIKEGHTLTIDGYYITDENYYNVNDPSDIEVNGVLTTIFISMADNPTTDRAGLDMSYVTLYLDGNEVDWNYNDYLWFNRKQANTDATGILPSGEDTPATKKIIRNGQMVIVRENQEFSLTGIAL